MESRLYQTRNRLVQQLKSEGLSPAEILQLLKELGQSYNDIDIDYLQCVFFPETSSPQRIPSKFSMPSALFTHKFTTYINTGVSGSGFIALLPKDITFHCLYGSNQAVSYSGNAGNQLLSQIKYYYDSDSRYIVQNFSQVRLVAAAVNLSYIGTVESESGFMNASQVFESEVGRISDEIVDNGYFSVRARPREGMRLVWLPKDEADFEFFDCNHRLNDATQSTDQLIDMGELADNRFTTAQLSVQAYDQNNVWQTVLAQDQSRIVQPNLVWGIGQKKFQSSYPDQLVCTWRGMPTNQNWLRVDVWRHFEGVPRTAVRDILSTSKPKCSLKSFDFVKEALDVPGIASSTMSSAQQIASGVRNSMYDLIIGDSISQVGSSTGSSNSSFMFGPVIRDTFNENVKQSLGGSSNTTSTGVTSVGPSLVSTFSPASYATTSTINSSTLF